MSPEPTDQVFDDVCAAAREEMGQDIGVESISSGTTVDELGMESIDLLGFLYILEKRFQIKIVFGEEPFHPTQQTTMNEIVEFVRGKMQAAAQGVK